MSSTWGRLDVKLERRTRTYQGSHVAGSLHPPGLAESWFRVVWNKMSPTSHTPDTAVSRAPGTRATCHQPLARLPCTLAPALPHDTHAPLWQCACFPVRMLVRAGQHTAVVIRKFDSCVPPPPSPPPSHLFTAGMKRGAALPYIWSCARTGCLRYVIVYGGIVCGGNFGAAANPDNGRSRVSCARLFMRGLRPGPGLARRAHGRRCCGASSLRCARLFYARAPPPPDHLRGPAAHWAGACRQPAAAVAQGWGAADWGAGLGAED